MENIKDEKVEVKMEEVSSEKLQKDLEENNGESLIDFQNMISSNDEQFLKDIKAQELENLQENSLVGLDNSIDQISFTTNVGDFFVRNLETAKEDSAINSSTLAKNATETYRCNFCRFDHSEQSEIIRHFECMHNIEYNCVEFKCKEKDCNFISNKAIDLKKHLTEEHINWSTWYKCHKCFLNTKDIVYLEYHFLTQHLKTIIKYCDMCSFCESDGQKMEKHKEVHLEILRLKEATIRKPETAKKDSVIHPNTLAKNAIKTFNCSFCKFSHSEQKEIIGHFKYFHNGEYNCVEFKCQETYCNFISNKTKDLKRHLTEKHINWSTSYKCHKCFLKTKDIVNLEYHFLTQHVKTVVKYCDLCSFCVSDERKMEKHKEVHHEQRLREAAKKNPTILKCPFCKFEPLYKYRIISHVKEQHKKEYEFVEFKCQHCAFITKTSESLVRHFVREHPFLPALYKCSKCTVKSNYDLSLEHHFLTEHLPKMIKYCNQCGFCEINDGILQRHMDLHRQQNALKGNDLDIPLEIIHVHIPKEDINSSYLSQSQAIFLVENQDTSEIPRKKLRIELSQDTKEKSDIVLDNYLKPTQTEDILIDQEQGQVKKKLSENKIKEEIDSIAITSEEEQINVNPVLNSEMVIIKKEEIDTQEEGFKQKIIQKQETLNPEEHSCYVCNFKLPERDDMLKHCFTDHIVTALKHFCKYCCYVTTDTTEFKEHYLKSHPNTPKFYKCSICLEKMDLDYIISFQDHYLQKHVKILPIPKVADMNQELQNTCHSCYFECNEKSTMLRHYRKEHIRYSCKYCNYIASRADLIQIHYFQYHKDLPTWYHCPKCSLNTKNLNAYKDHYVQRHIEAKNPCEMCGYIRRSDNYHHFCRHGESHIVEFLTGIITN